MLSFVHMSSFHRWKNIEVYGQGYKVDTMKSLSVAE